MKNFILFFLIFMCDVCFGQGVRVQLYRTKTCTSIEKLDTNYYIIPMPWKLDVEFKPQAGTTYLPGKGFYMIAFPEGPYDLDTLIEIRDTGLFVFRFKEPKIGLYNGGMDSPGLYRSCGDLINGYAEDFYPNGNIKIRGNFLEGRTKDSIVTFFPNGKVEKRIVHLHKNVFIEQFDSLSNRLSVTYNKSIQMFILLSHKSIYFFNDGKIKRIESTIRGVEKIKEFYSNGQLKVIQNKRRRIEYFENGKKNITYTWKYKKDNITRRAKDFTIFKYVFDENSKILQSEIYKEWIDSPQPILDISKADWIESLIKYKDGKIIFKIEDMDTKEYLKKYPVD